ncbi:hypothetical protein BDZ89DRAFT_633959 [Hymenopellis radicata]|nr:hypothetical protein BDZ89DRAFT_633959 [Hymenopellis radicata]
MLSSMLRGDVRDVVFATRPFPIWFRAGGKAKMTTLLRILEEDRLLPRSSTARSALPERRLHQDRRHTEKETSLDRPRSAGSTATGDPDH